MTALKMMLKAIQEVNPLEIIRKYSRPTEKRGTFEFDRMIEDKLVEILRSEGFNGVIIGEERGVWEGDGKEGYIVIDPVDGSVNASKGLPFFSTLMFYTRGRFFEDVEAAVVYDPLRDVYYVAERGKGARKIVNGAEEKVMVPDELTEPLIIDMTHTRMMLKVDKLRKLGALRRLGSIGLATAMIVDGYIDAVIDITRSTRPLDVVASLFIVREARGKVVTDVRDILTFEGMNFIAGKKQVVNLLARTFWWRRKL